MLNTAANPSAEGPNLSIWQGSRRRSCPHADPLRWPLTV